MGKLVSPLSCFATSEEHKNLDCQIDSDSRWVRKLPHLEWKNNKKDFAVIFKQNFFVILSIAFDYLKAYYIRKAYTWKQNNNLYKIGVIEITLILNNKK